MINLLPDSTKREIRAARTNVVLRRYVTVLAAAMIFLATVGYGVYVVLMDTQTSAENTLKDNQAKASSYLTSKNQVASFQASLATAKATLDKEVRYSKVITGIAALMPTGAVLDSLNLSTTSFGTPTTLTVYAKTTTAALAVKDNFQSSPLFSNVAFVSLSSASQQSKDYPITATLSVTINRGAAQ